MATFRQKLAATKLMENNGKSVSKAMREAGYDPRTAKNPQQLTRSKGWKQMLDEYFPDVFLKDKHSELLRASSLKSEVFDINDSDDDIRLVIESEPGVKVTRIVKRNRDAKSWKIAYFLVPIHEQQRLSLDMAYKLKGHYAPDKVAVGSLAEFEDMDDEDLKEAAGIQDNDDNTDNTEESAGDSSV